MASQTEKIIDIVKTAISSSQVSANSEMGDPREWTSLSHVEILLELEKVFQIKIPLTHLVRLTSIKKIDEYLQEKGLRSE